MQKISVQLKQIQNASWQNFRTKLFFKTSRFKFFYFFFRLVQYDFDNIVYTVNYLSLLLIKFNSSYYKRTHFGSSTFVSSNSCKKGISILTNKATSMPETNSKGMPNISSISMLCEWNLFMPIFICVKSFLQDLFDDLIEYLYDSVYL